MDVLLSKTCNGFHVTEGHSAGCCCHQIQNLLILLSSSLFVYLINSTAEYEWVDFQ